MYAHSYSIVHVLDKSLKEQIYKYTIPMNILENSCEIDL